MLTHKRNPNEIHFPHFNTYICTKTPILVLKLYYFFAYFNCGDVGWVWVWGVGVGGGGGGGYLALLTQSYYGSNAGEVNLNCMNIYWNVS